MIDYQEFLQSKIKFSLDVGFNIELSDIHEWFKDWQKAAIQWALRKGRAAIFADCGLGKTGIQVEWAKFVAEYTQKPVLLVAPLAVVQQTIDDMYKHLGIRIKYCLNKNDVDGLGLFITNYDRLKHFDADVFGGVVLDESSILKNYSGLIKQLILSMFDNTPFKLACTATPSPNDELELGNHAEFLGVMKSREMIQKYFYNDLKNGITRLAQHAEEHFWAWVTSWAICARKPSDLGEFSDEGYILPELNFIPHIVKVDQKRAWDKVDPLTGQRSLIMLGKVSATNLYTDKKETMMDRCHKARIVCKQILSKSPSEPIIVWCETNKEADELKRLLPYATELRGSEKAEIKSSKLKDFSIGKIQVLITKPKMAAYGLNWQHCGEQVWTSVTHKFEQFYQGYKRSHRFGRTRPVNCHIIYAESEKDVVGIVRQKQGKHERMQDSMAAVMKRHGMGNIQNTVYATLNDKSPMRKGKHWRLYHGDSAISMINEPDESTDFIIQSPPFKSLFLFSPNVEDLANIDNYEQFKDQYLYILHDELRRLKPGAYKAEHCKDLGLSMTRDGVMGLEDFPSELIQIHKEAGYRFVGVKTIWKDPDLERQRTNNAGLSWGSSFVKRGERCRQGCADFMLIFQKPSNNDVPKTAVPYTPVPKVVIDRCVDIWTNEDERVVSPYHPIASDDSKVGMIFLDHAPTDQEIGKVQCDLMDGRNVICRVVDFSKIGNLVERIKKFNVIFHSRIALTDGSWLIVFWKWVTDMSEVVNVTHDLKSDTHCYIGNQSPQFYDSDRGYSIKVWNKYASPVWFDFDGMPSSHPDIWMDINVTNTLNKTVVRRAKGRKDERHVSVLQLDVIERCIDLYTKLGDVVSSSFAGVGSELVTAIKMRRNAYGSELKFTYFDVASEILVETEDAMSQPTLFDWVKHNEQTATT